MLKKIELKEFMSSLGETGEPVQTSTISSALHRSCLYGRGEKRKLILKKEKKRAMLRNMTAFGKIMVS